MFSSQELPSTDAVHVRVCSWMLTSTKGLGMRPCLAVLLIFTQISVSNIGMTNDAVDHHGPLYVTFIFDRICKAISIT